MQALRYYVDCFFCLVS